MQEDEISIIGKIKQVKSLLIGIIFSIFSMFFGTIKNIETGGIFGWETPCNDTIFTGCVSSIPLQLYLAIILGLLALSAVFFDQQFILVKYQNELSAIAGVFGLLLFGTISNFTRELNNANSAYQFRLDLGAWTLLFASSFLLYYGLNDKVWNRLDVSNKLAFLGTVLLVASLWMDTINFPVDAGEVFDMSWTDSCSRDNLLIPCANDTPLLLYIAIFINITALSLYLTKNPVISTKKNLLPLLYSLSGVLSLVTAANLWNDKKSINDELGDVFSADLGLGGYVIFTAFFVLLSAALIRFEKISSWYTRSVSQPIRDKYPYGRKSPGFSSILFIILLVVVILITLFQPASDADSRVFAITNAIILISIFSIMAISLNIHTGLTGMVNFGVIFFVGIGAVATSMISCGQGFHPFIAIGFGILIAAVIGYLLAFPTLKLREDYFAIVTISIGEILRNLLKVEITLRCNSSEEGVDRPGITDFDKPFESWWNNSVFVTQYDYPYKVLLMFITLAALFITYVIAQFLLNSPYGRVMKTIREDEDVVQSYGYDVFKYKASILAIGAGIAALAGGLWAWQLGNIFPAFMDPVRSTFLVWAAFILGGKGNNKGMVVGASIIILSDQTFRNFGSVDKATEANTFLNTLDDIFRFVVADIGGWLFGPESYTSTFVEEARVNVDVTHLQLTLVGLIIMIILLRSEAGILPEIPYRPHIPKTFSSKVTGGTDESKSGKNLDDYIDQMQSSKGRKEEKPNE